NNLADHNRGATGAALVRLFPAQYTDGVYLPQQEPHLPNPRQISNIAMSGQSGLLSYRNRSVLSVHRLSAGYQKYVDPGISAEFEAAAVRFGLTLAPPGVYKRYISQITFNPNLQSSQDVDELIMGMASQIAEREDNIIVEDLRDYMYGPLRFSRSDAVALTIQRGRDFGLPSYNQIRESLNMRPVNSWDEINPKLNNTQVLELAELYENDTSRLDLFVGGLLESQEGPGPVFSSIILDQFERIRNADRFWFENKQNGLFTEEEIQAIRNTTFHDVLLDVTSAEEGDIQRNVFFWVNGDPCPQPQPITSSDLHPCKKVSSMSYFDNSSKAGFGATVVVLFLFPVASYIVACVVAHVRTARYKRFQKKLRGSTTDKKPAHETIGQMLQFYSVMVLLCCVGKSVTMFAVNPGTPEEKSKLLFSMHDIKEDGFLSKEEFTSLLRSFIDISGSALSKSQAEDGIAAMLQAAGLDNKDSFSWEDFHFLLYIFLHGLIPQVIIFLSSPNTEAFYFETVVRVFPGMEVLGKKKLSRQHSSAVEELTHRPDGEQDQELRQRQIKKIEQSNPQVYVRPQRERYNRNPVQQWIQQFKRFIENYRRHIICMVIIYGITAGLALERCYYYGLQAHASGIPETSLVGVLVSRGSAAAISFLFPYMLLTVCRNLITMCRETFLNRYIPFDAAIDLHRHMAIAAVVLSVVHSLGHVVNVYIFCISDLSILACLFPRVFSNNGSELPMKWTFWFFKTVPGLTGVLLLLIFAFMYVFASHYFRRISFRGFWITHHLYVLVYVLTVIHGSYALLQEPRFHIYLIPPGLLFLLDKLISLNRKKVEIPVVKAELLPSDVTYLEFKRPQGFVYRSGQWVRIACLALGTDEYHPFTLTSAPHEETLSLHIRAVGPWTSKLREAYTPEKLQEFGGYPKLYLDGPFGEGHQEWTDYEVSVLVGAGIGVTPFASILKDLVFKSSVKFKFHCKKVYFIWVTRTQRQFEWVSEIIREVEDMDAQELVSVHFYITQLAEKFDLRTTMLYVCERHFQKVWNRSLFTGLRSITHFGRPPFLAFLSSLQEVHPEVEKIGVFSCGPPGLTKNVEKACQQMNKRDQTHFVHHYENF
uniref:NAD(P)H oxidase (H2O2-forming) n=1 Tax=Sinocyclocheilus grahami TaxID=75366 RepID=A0A672S969_SINGR